MSVSIEVYRSRIGSHDGSVKAKEASARLQGKFCNQMLMMFDLNVFYLPCLKWPTNKCERIPEQFVTEQVIGEVIGLTSIAMTFLSLL